MVAVACGVARPASASTAATGACSRVAQSPLPQYTPGQAPMTEEPTRLGRSVDVVTDIEDQ